MNEREREREHPEDHYLRERIRQALATNPDVGMLNARVRIDGARVLLYGEAASREKGEYARALVQRMLPEREVAAEFTPPVPDEAPPDGGPYVRVAAAGDLHYDALSRGRLRVHFERAAHEADLLLLAGDLTDTGKIEEAEALATDLRGIGIPIVAVLGNHDYQADRQDDIRKLLEDAGVIVLEGDSIVLELGGMTLGVAGTKGFGGGFEGACGTYFGEREMKVFIAHTELLAARLKEALERLKTDMRVALLHYAPVRETLTGERAEVYPFLGSYLLGRAIDEAGADLVIHGHAHYGRERGLTRGGIPVRNVAIPMLKRAHMLCYLTPRVSRRTP